MRSGAEGIRTSDLRRAKAAPYFAGPFWRLQICCKSLYFRHNAFLKFSGHLLRLLHGCCKSAGRWGAGYRAINLSKAACAVRRVRAGATLSPRRAPLDASLRGSGHAPTPYTSLPRSSRHLRLSCWWSPWWQPSLPSLRWRRRSGAARTGGRKPAAINYARKPLPAVPTG